ncbi:hypothetical protein EAG_12915 [Camponotus floridanus]|uniref:Uncharacterized protein n=1 Tax=Camponotus floridanus TaxID=104421 RepID=E2ATU3_CAMFO|nr:hypothetical protein EAG_12915 [Camponotus floridanus]
MEVEKRDGATRSAVLGTRKPSAWPACLPACPVCLPASLPPACLPTSQPASQPASHPKFPSRELEFLVKDEKIDIVELIMMACYRINDFKTLKPIWDTLIEIKFVTKDRFIDTTKKTICSKKHFRDEGTVVLKKIKDPITTIDRDKIRENKPTDSIPLIPRERFVMIVSRSSDGLSAVSLTDSHSPTDLVHELYAGTTGSGPSPPHILDFRSRPGTSLYASPCCLSSECDFSSINFLPSYMIQRRRDAREKPRESRKNGGSRATVTIPDCAKICDATGHRSVLTMSCRVRLMFFGTSPGAGVFPCLASRGTARVVVLFLIAKHPYPAILFFKSSDYNGLSHSVISEIIEICRSDSFPTTCPAWVTLLIVISKIWKCYTAISLAEQNLKTRSKIIFKKIKCKNRLNTGLHYHRHSSSFSNPNSPSHPNNPSDPHNFNNPNNPNDPNNRNEPNSPSDPDNLNDPNSPNCKINDTSKNFRLRGLGVVPPVQDAFPRPAPPLRSSELSRRSITYK